MTDWLWAVATWAVPAVAFNAVMLAWRSRMLSRGPAFPGETFMRRYLWTVINMGLACLIVGFATSPVHPGNSLFTVLGGLGMPVLVLGYIAWLVIEAVAEVKAGDDEDVR